MTAVPTLAADGPRLAVASTGARFGASVLTALTHIAAWVIASLGLRVADALLPLLLLAAWYVGVLVLLLRTAASPGQHLLGLTTVDLTTGRPAGGKAFGKACLMWLISNLTCGIGLLVGVLVVQAPANQNLFDRMVGTTVARRSPGARRPEARAASWPAPPAVDQRAPSTRLLADAPGPAPAEPAAVTMARLPGTGPAPLSPGHPVLEFDQGSTVPLVGELVVGRDPEAPGSAPMAEPFRIPDRDRSISKTHLLIGNREGLVVVTDLHSTNGVRVETALGSEHRIEPGVEVAVPPGSTIRYGGRTIRVRP